MNLYVWEVFLVSALTLRYNRPKRIGGVKAACILRTLVFAQKEDCGLSHNPVLDTNRREFEHYKQTLDRTHTRYQIVECDEQEDDSLIVRVRKRYNDKADATEYFR